MMLLNFFLCIGAAKRLMHVKHDAIMHIFHLTVKTVLRNTCLHLENCIYSVTGTISRTAERKTGRRNDGAYRSDSRIPLNL